MDVVEVAVGDAGISAMVVGEAVAAAVNTWGKTLLPAGGAAVCPHPASVSTRLKRTRTLIFNRLHILHSRYYYRSALPGRQRASEKKERKQTVELDQTWFEEQVIAVLDSLPDEFAQHLANLEIVVEPAPRPEHRRAVGIKPWQTLYGLYQGTPLSHRSSSYNLVPPDIITIFTVPLLRDYPTEERLKAQIRRTVLHELAHHFGTDDDRLHEIGAY